jgi:SpoIID/LytB domain protein
MSPHVAIHARRAALSTLLLLAVACALVSPPTAQATEVSFAVTGGGYGHGIGLSQYGAEGYAKQGRTYDWILAHYYQGTTLATKAISTVNVNLDAGANYTSSSSSYNKGYSRSSWHIRPGYAGGSLTLGTSSVALPDLTYTFSSSKGVITVTGSDGKVYGRFTGTVKVTPAPGSPPLLQVRDASGPFGHTYVRYRGTMTLYANASGIKNSSGTVTQPADHLKLVNTLNMEDYLYGVVPRESPSSWNAEALKAQAVAARSYAYGSSNDLYCTTSSQVYNGQSKGSSRPATMSDGDADKHEKDSTNRAVLATAGQVVVSGSTVVKTYFSSSSGGHTASIQDSWLTSTPHTYYTGVDDADSLALSGNPNASWSAGTFTGTSMASKMRAAFSDYTLTSSKRTHAEPSPATVSSISVDRAESGFVRYVTMKWSNGPSHKITGDDFRHALGLKSNKFYIATTPATVPVARFQQTDSRIAYSGAWSSGSNKALSAGSHVFASAAGARAYVAFTGTAVTWVGRTGPTYGTASVSIDGSAPVKVSCVSSATSDQHAVYSVTGLSAGAHHLMAITVDGPAAGAAGGYVSLDAIDVTGGTLIAYAPPTVRLQENSSAIAYAGTWTTGKSTHLSGGAQRYSAKAKAAATLTFEGTGATWIGNRSPSYGRAAVYVDGHLAKTVDQYSRSTAYVRRLYSVSGLTYGTHAVRIVVTGTKAAASHGYTTAVDAFEVQGRTLAP